MSILTTSIDIKKLTLEDWLLIAESSDSQPVWGLLNWLDYASTDTIEGLSRKQIREIAERMNCSMSLVESQIRLYTY